jgi:hypothetical protein
VNSLRNPLRLFQENEESVETRADEQVEDYLDYLCAPLIGFMPYRERQRFRLEAQAHIDALIAEYREQGAARPEAVQRALREFGEPGQVGQVFLQEWMQGAPRGGPDVRATVVRAFALFGIATDLNLFAIQRYAGERYYLLDPFPCLLALAMLSPLIAGCVTGLSRPARLRSGTGCAILLCIAASTAVGLVMLPQTEGLLFALFQLLFWLPAGCLSALGTACLVRQHRRLRFWRSARRVA